MATLPPTHSLPHSIRMDRLPDEDTPSSVHMVTLDDGTRTPLSFEVQGSLGGRRALTFTREQWAVLEREYKLLVQGLPPGSDITFDMTTQTLSVQAQGEAAPRVRRLDISVLNAKGLTEAFVDFKKKEIVSTSFRRYEPGKKGDVNGPKALVEPHKMTERLKSLHCKDWNEFTTKYLAQLISHKSPANQQAVRDLIQEAKRFQESLERVLRLELTRLQGEIAREGMDRGVRSNLQTSMQKLQYFYQEIAEMDIFALGSALAHITPGRSADGSRALSSDEMLEAAKQQAGLLAKFIEAQKGNFAEGTWLQSLRTPPSDLLPIEKEHIRGIIGMTLGGPNDRETYEEFMGGSRRDSREETLIIRYLQGHPSIHDVESGTFPIPGLELLPDDLRASLLTALGQDLRRPPVVPIP